MAAVSKKNTATKGDPLSIKGRFDPLPIVLLLNNVYAEWIRANIPNIKNIIPAIFIRMLIRYNLLTLKLFVVIILYTYKLDKS